MGGVEKYSVDYFIEKFEAIPDENWTTGWYSDGAGACCALGHCEFVMVGGSRFSEEEFKLQELFAIAALTVPDVNDGLNPLYAEPTPKARILAALRDIKARLAK